MIRAPAAGMSGKRLLLPQDNLKMGATDGHVREIFFHRPGVRRRGGVAMPDLDEDPSPGGNQPAAELLPELYAELRRLAAALTTRLRARPGASSCPRAWR
jgi:hypothetical protein